MAEQNMACTLGGPELIERIAEWAEVSKNALSRRVEAGRITSIYPWDDEVVGRLRRLIAAEADCCSGMEFTLTERGDRLEVELRVPDEISGMLAMMLGVLEPGKTPEGEVAPVG